MFFPVRLSVTPGYSVSFTVTFECSQELFAAERTNVEAFNCILLYSLISFQMSVLSILSVRTESNKNSLDSGNTHMLFLQEVERK